MSWFGPASAKAGSYSYRTMLTGSVVVSHGVMIVHARTFTPIPMSVTEVKGSDASTIVALPLTKDQKSVPVAWGCSPASRSYHIRDPGRVPRWLAHATEYWEVARGRGSQEGGRDA